MTRSNPNTTLLALIFVAVTLGAGCMAPSGSESSECTCTGNVGGAPVNVGCGELFCADGEQFLCTDDNAADYIGACDGSGGSGTPTVSGGGSGGSGSGGGGSSSGGGGGTLCSDTCHDAFDGYCDDGGPGSDYSICELGTDCGDCGPRDGSGGGSTPTPSGGCEPSDPPYCDGDSLVTCPSAGATRRFFCEYGCSAGACTEAASSFRVTLSSAADADPIHILGSGDALTSRYDFGGSTYTVAPDVGLTDTNTTGTVVRPDPGACDVSVHWFVNDSEAAISFTGTDPPGMVDCFNFMQEVNRSGAEVRIEDESAVYGGSSHTIDIDFVLEIR